MRLTLALLLAPALLAAQTPDTGRGIALPVTDSALRIPADRVSDLVPWVAGGGLDETGLPTWHGIPVERGEWTIDGVRWASGLRSTGFAGFGPRSIRLEPGLGALAHAQLSASAIGPLTLGFTTLGAGDRWTAHGSTETGAPFRPTGGTGDSRLQAAAGGPLGGGFRLQLGGALDARQAASGGIGYGDSPYYLASGIDTTMTYQGPSLDSISAPIQRYTPSDKVPYTPRSLADWTARIDGRVGAATTWAHWVGTRQAEGLFQYHDAYNPAQITGVDQQAFDLAAGVAAPLGSRRFTMAVALQHERSEQGPLTYASQLDTRSPGLGLMLGGLGLRWNMDNFPVDDQLVTNYRENLAGSRRSPYDLENTDQYRLQDLYRNSPYATFGWSEGGGPVGQLRFYDDRRFVASAGLAQDRLLGGSASIGVEVIRHDARLYAANLTSQANSNVWIEHPDEAAATLGWSYAGSGWALDAGLRVDRFTSDARRPYVRVTDPAEPNFGKYVWFPRGSSAAVTDSSVRWVPDGAHTAAAPHVVLRGTLGTGWDARLRYQRSATVPDFADLYDGVNTDIAITNLSSAYSQDVGHEIVDHLEAGLDRRRGPVHAGATYFEDHYKKVVATRLGAFYDPLKKQVNDLLYHPLIDGPTIKGLELSAGTDITTHLVLGGSYTYLTTDDITYIYGFLTQDASPLRHHTLAATARLTGPDHGIAAGLGALVTVRVLSGSAQVVDPSGIPFTGPSPIRSEGIPAWKSLDLRLVKGVTIGGHRATAYVDARNLLNTANLVHAFALGDPRHAPVSQELAWEADSASYATEATRNGLYNSGTGTVDLTFGGAGRGGCGAWLTASGASNPPDCAYLIAAEQRFGNGDGLFTAAEQHAASTSFYLTQFGSGAFNGPPRAIRVGLEVGF